jgi:excisionase family DNA binding protein
MTRFRIQAVYTVPELSSMTGISRWRLLRLLRRNKVAMVKMGVHWLIPLSELTEKLSWLQSSAEQRDMLQDSLSGIAPR